jgi:hypothetical protein
VSQKRKPLKRFRVFLSSFDTGLKPGVNEMSQSRAFEAKKARTGVPPVNHAQEDHSYP